MAQLNANRFAGPAEAALLREQLELDAKDDAELEARLLKASSAQHTLEVALEAAEEAAESARAYTRHIREQRELVAQRMLRARGLLHPVRRVPDELLSQIFVHLLEPYLTFYHTFDSYKLFRGIPFVCAAVCRRWRVAALSTSKLWTLLAFDTRDVTEASTKAWAAYLDMFMSYSKALPLSMVLLTKNPVESAIPPALEPTVRAFIGLSERLHIKIQCDTPFVELHGTAQLLGDTLPRVCDLHLAADLLLDDALCYLPGLPAMPRLRSLTLTFLWLSWDQQSLLPSVKVADLHPGCSFEIDPSQLSVALSKMPILQDLTLVRFSFADSAPTVIDLPNVERFNIYAECGPLANVSFHMPVIQEATISLYGDEDLAPGIIHLVESSLCQPTLERLTIVPRFEAREALADALKPLTGMLHLYLAQCVVRSSFLQRLAQPCGDGTWICPILERLDAGLPETDMALLPALTQLVRARKDHHDTSGDSPVVEPLLFLSLVWNEPPSDEDLVDFRADFKRLAHLAIWNDVPG